MAGRGDPPEGTPEGLPGGDEDEFRFVVFDEAFVRAARLQEFSAQERMGRHARAVRSLPEWDGRTAGRRFVLLTLVIVLALGTAFYLGAADPAPRQTVKRAGLLRTTVISLAPRESVPGGAPADLWARSPAAAHRVAASGIMLPGARRTRHFSESQVISALTIAKDYLVESSLNPGVLTGSGVRSVRILLDPDQLEQFDRSMSLPVSDGRHAAVGWLVRFDPAAVALADPEIRVQGDLRYEEVASDAIEVTSNHTFTYALRPAAASAAGAGARFVPSSLFTVRRELRLRFDADDLHYRRTELVTSQVLAGPQSCSDEVPGRLRPLLAGERATLGAPAGTDPYVVGRPAAALCGALTPSAQPAAVPKPGPGAPGPGTTYRSHAPPAA
jgi:hypothetical protein